MAALLRKATTELHGEWGKHLVSKRSQTRFFMWKDYTRCRTSNNDGKKHNQQHRQAGEPRVHDEDVRWRRYRCPVVLEGRIQVRLCQQDPCLLARAVLASLRRKCQMMEKSVTPGKCPFDFFGVQHNQLAPRLRLASSAGQNLSLPQLEGIGRLQRRQIIVKATT